MAMLKRDRSFAALLILLGAIALAIALSQDRFLHVWVFEPAHLEATFYTSWGAGLVLGVAVAIRDRVLGVRDQLRHRPMSATQLQLGRLATLCLVLVAWWVLGPLGSWIAEAVGGHLASVGRIERFGSVFAVMAPAASGAALAFLCASLPLAWWAQAVLAAGILVVAFPLCDVLAVAEGFSAPATFASAHLALAAMLLALSFPFAAVERDRDRSWTPRVPRWATSALLAVGVVGLCVPYSMLAGQLAANATRTYPMIARVSGDYVLIRWDPPRSSQQPRAIVVDSNHEAVGRVLERAEVGYSTQASSSYAKDPEIEPPQFGPRVWEALRVDRRGFANCLLHDSRDWSEHYVAFGRGDFTTPFRAGVRLVSLAADGHASRTVSTVQSVIWAAEPEATEVFCFDPQTGKVRAVPLPEGDRVVALVEQESGDPRAHASFEQASALLRCERGIYVFGRDGLLLADPKAVAALDAREAEKKNRRETTSAPELESAVADALTPTIRLVDPAGKVLFEHAFAPRTGMEQFVFATALVPSLLRPPLLQIGANLFASTESLVFTPFVDPVVVGGRRAWLVFANCIVSGLLAAASRRRLRRAGADARTLRFWSVAVALTGLIGALLCEWFEPSRAWRLPVAEPAPAPRIRTGDAA